jgi:hypothetical protein
MCFIVHKTTSELECVILTTQYLVGAKNNDNWCARKGDLQRAFLLDVLMITSLKLSFITNGDNTTSVGLAPGETIHFDSLEFTADLLGCLSLYPEEGDSGSIFEWMVHSGSPSLHTTLEDASEEGGAASASVGSFGSPGP